MKNFSKIVDNFDVTTKKYVDDGLAEKANSADLATVANGVSGKLDKSGGTVTGDLTVGGNLTINGTTTTVDSTTLQVKDKLIEVAHGNTTALTTPAGLVAPKYDGTNSGALVFDSTGTAYVGDVTLKDGNIDVANSQLQPLATRTGLVGGNLVQYDSSAQTLKDSGKKISDLALKTDIPTNYVTTNTTQTISGAKTFTAQPIINTSNGLKFTSGNCALRIYNTGASPTDYSAIEVRSNSSSTNRNLFIDLANNSLVVGQASGNADTTYKVNVKDSFNATTISENGTSLANKYLGKTAKAADADKLDGNDSTYYLNYDNLTNKPTIPTVNNGTLTIQQNGTNIATFGANQSTNTTANITTITDVKMNGTSKVTNSVADLGTVLTDASKFATSAQGTKADNAMPKSGGTFTGNVSLPKELVFTDNTNPFIKMTTGGTDFYFQSTSGQFGLGPTWNKATHWDSNGNVTFPTTPKVGSSSLALMSDIPDTSKHGYTELTNENLNTITEAGWYRAASDNTCTNRPSAFTSTIPFVLEVEKSTDAYIKQTMYQTGNAADTYFVTYVRYSSNSGSSWYSWYKQQTMADGYGQMFSGRKSFLNGINISHAPLEFNTSSGSNGQFAMSQGSSSAPKWVNLQVKVNGTTYTADNSGLIDLGTISGGGSTSTSQYNDIY